NNGTSNATSSGLSAGGKTAVAVVVPVVVVALLVLAGLFLWRRRKQRKNAEEARRKEVEEYGFNPNNDPTLPAIAADSSPEMAEDINGGYRGWGNKSSNRKVSTTLSGGHTGSDPGYTSPSSPGGPGSDDHSVDPLYNRRETMNSDDLGALGAAPLASSNRHNASDINRGPSNASSAYSGANRSDHSDERVPVPPIGQAYEYPDPSYGFAQHGPYGDGSYGGGGGQGVPVMREVSARRQTRMENAGMGLPQANSGIAQNF
ncbi:hypothetical protein LTR28_007430, partial [Elasticomyces elasticus]